MQLDQIFILFDDLRRRSRRAFFLRGGQIRIGAIAIFQWNYETGRLCKGHECQIQMFYQIRRIDGGGSQHNIISSRLYYLRRITVIVIYNSKHPIFLLNHAFNCSATLDRCISSAIIRILACLSSKNGIK